MTATTASLGTVQPAPSNASLSGLDGVNLFLAGILAGFGPYLTAYLADQKWTQENIGFILTASSLAGLLSQLPGGELLDTVRSKRALIVAGVTTVAISAIIIAFEPSFPLVFTALMLQGITGGFLGPAIAAISLGLVGHAALPERLGRNQRFASTGKPGRVRAYGSDRIFFVVSNDILDSRRTQPSTVRCSRSHPCSRHPLRPRLRGAPSPHVWSTREGKPPQPLEEPRAAHLCHLRVPV
jgi:hypothetical protein